MSGARCVRYGSVWGLGLPTVTGIGFLGASARASRLPLRCLRGLQLGPHDKQAAVEAAWPSCLSILMSGHVRSVVQACFRRVRSKSRETCRT